jgi:hypothetical protein
VLRLERVKVTSTSKDSAKYTSSRSTGRAIFLRNLKGTIVADLELGRLVTFRIYSPLILVPAQLAYQHLDELLVGQDYYPPLTQARFVVV